MASRELTVEEIMAILPETPGRLSSLTDGLTDAQLHAAPEPGAWSVNDVLAHLRACNDVLGGNVRRILDEDGPAWRGMSPRTWQARSGYHDWTFREAFEAFTAQRAKLLAPRWTASRRAPARSGPPRYRSRRTRPSTTAPATTGPGWRRTSGPTSERSRTSSPQ
ncbi:MAG TPA: DinB family protein [candidate division Zixibacteria bacterium]|nr:DinB family protein [candidate division Zixibacteria bacterium]